ncbi:MAG TPA: glycosyltransferase [Candidatus Xenobia bacterium]|nr:glycosyltransferase [Candidatus Xenobia bacterium]
MSVLVWIDSFLLYYYAVLCVIYLALFALALLDSLRHQQWIHTLPLDRLATSPLAPPVSVLVPARNEAAGIVQSVESLLGLKYPDFEVVVINDGSSDATLKRLQEAFGLIRIDFSYHARIPTARVRDVFASPTHPRLLVCDKLPGGKADALNAGLNLARGAYFCTVDADAVLDRDALLRVMLPVYNDRTVVASGGVVRLANGSVFANGRLQEARLPRSPLELLQVVEYLRAFLWGRQGWSALGGLLIISGAFGIFRRELVLEIGGFRTRTVGEDMDLVVRLHRRLRQRGKPYVVRFVPDPICWTEAPASLRQLSCQRRRWQQGLGQSLWHSRDLLFSRRGGRIGWFIFPYQIVFEFFGPLIETLGLISVAASAALGLLNQEYFFRLFLFAYLFGTFISMAAVYLEDLSYHRYRRASEVARLLLISLFDYFPYRLLINLFRIQGMFDFFRQRARWGELARRGFTEPQGAPAHPA